MTPSRLLAAVVAVVLCIDAGGAAAAPAVDRAAALVVYPYVVLDTARGVETTVQLSNTADVATRVHCAYESDNGHCRDSFAICRDASGCAPSEPCNPGWYVTEFDLTLTRGQPLAWRASAGLRGPLPENTAVIPPLQEDPFIGALRCVAVDDQGQASADNVLTGGATVEVFRPAPAPAYDSARYNALGFAASAGDADHDGGLLLDDQEYAACSNIQLIDHFFDGAVDPVGGDSAVQTTLVLLPCSADYVVPTPASIDVSYVVFNEFGERFSSPAPLHFSGQLVTELSTLDATAFSAAARGTLTGQTRLRGVGPQGESVVALAIERDHSLADPNSVRSWIHAAIGVGRRDTPDVVRFADVAIAPLTPTPTAETSPTPTPTRSGTFRPTPLPTATPTPNVGSAVVVGIGAARGKPGDTVAITVSLQVRGRGVSAASNEISFPSRLFHIDVDSCSKPAGAAFSLSVTSNGSGWVAVAQSVDPELLTSGPLYTCRVQIDATTPPGTYVIQNATITVVDGAGVDLDTVGTDDGRIVVSLVPLRGDLTLDGSISGADLDALITALFTPAPPVEADVNADGHTGGADVAALVALRRGADFSSSNPVAARRRLIERK